MSDLVPEDLIGSSNVELLDDHDFKIIKKTELIRLHAQIASIGRISPGAVSPKETWPDDTEIDQWIDEAENLNEALFEIVEKYEIPVTNNMRRWQDGHFIRDVGEFIDDIRRVVEKHGL